MKRALRDKWVAALRSGDYLQGYGRLRGERFRTDSDEPVATYCCLGVLCDILDPNRWEHDAWKVRDTFAGEDGPYFLDTELDEVMLAHVGLDSETQKMLVSLNDDDQAHFTVIADDIEQTVPIDPDDDEPVQIAA